MITKEQMLKPTGDELSRLAGEVLQVKHDMANDGVNHVTCKVCDETLPLMCRWDLPERYPCEVPLTWDEAMKWRDWAVEKFGDLAWQDPIWKLYHDVSGDRKKVCVYAHRFIAYAQPEHYIKAACLCKLQGGKP
jgi:hypothetical protein